MARSWFRRMASYANPFDDQPGAGFGPNAPNPAPKYGTARSGGGPEASNFQLGGTADYANQFAQRGNEEYGRRAGTADAAAAAAAGRATPQTDFSGANAALGSVQGAEANQGQVFGGLMNFAQGPQGPSGAQAMLQEGTNKSLRSNLALARSGTGFGESTAGLSNAQRLNADNVASAGNQAAMLRANEDANFRNQQLQAFGQAGGVAGQQGQLALGRAGQSAGQSQFLTQAELEAQGQRDQAQLAFGQQGLDAFGRGRSEELAAQSANLQGSMGLEGTRADIYGAELGHQRGMRELNQKRSTDVLGGVLGAFSGGGSIASLAGAASDPRMKKNVRKMDLRERYEGLT